MKLFFFFFPAFLSAKIFFSLHQNISERATTKPVTLHPFPAINEKGSRVVYDNGNSDFTFGYDFVVSPEGAHVATIYDDFVVIPGKGHQLTFNAFQALVAVDFSKPVCLQLIPDFQILNDSPNGNPMPVHGPFTVHTQMYHTTVDQQVGVIYYLTIKFTRVTLGVGHYWFKFTCYCSEPEINMFALATSLVQHDEAWIATPDFTGPISVSPIMVPPHDFAYVLLLHS